MANINKRVIINNLHLKQIYEVIPGFRRVLHSFMTNVLFALWPEDGAASLNIQVQRPDVRFSMDRQIRPENQQKKKKK